MKKLPTSHEITSTMTVHRMRKRGPIESYKINKFNQDSATDISLLEKHFHQAHDNLKDYIAETYYGCDKSIIIGEAGKERYTGECSVINDIINNKKNNFLIISKGVM